MKLHQRGTTYHFRIRVPADLVTLLGRREIHQSLRTDDGRTARSRASHLKSSVIGGFERLRFARLAASQDDELTDLAQGFLTSLGSTRRTGDVGLQLDKPLRLRELTKLHLQEKKGTISPRSYDKMRYSYRVAIHHIGNIPLRELNRSVCRSYREALKHSPQYLLRNDAGSKNVTRTLSTKSINHHIQFLSALLRWATLEELIGGNPAEGLTIKKNGKASDDRFAFSDEQLQHLLGNLWSDEVRPERRWVPLIALWSGMRQEEICQLRHSDIIKPDDVYCFRVTAEAGSIKSASAERLVPVHPWLIEKGFLRDVWRPDKAPSNERIWSSLRKTKLGRYSNALCKWFSRYKRMKGFDDPKLCFHSLRHTFINEAKQRELPEPIIRQLVGHREASITLGRYGKDYDIEKLNHYMNIVSFNIQLDANC